MAHAPALAFASGQARTARYGVDMRKFLLTLLLVCASSSYAINKADLPLALRPLNNSYLCSMPLIDYFGDLENIMSNDLKMKILSRAEKMFRSTVINPLTCLDIGDQAMFLFLKINLSPPSEDAVSLIKGEKVRAYKMEIDYFRYNPDTQNQNLIILWSGESYGVYVGTDSEAAEYFDKNVDVFLHAALDSYNQANPK